MIKIAVVIALSMGCCQSVRAQPMTTVPPYLSFDELRTSGHLYAIFPNSSLSVCTSGKSCIVIGIIRPDNTIEWNENATLDVLKTIVQSQYDMTIYQSLQHKKLMEKR